MRLRIDSENFSPPIDDGCGIMYCARKFLGDSNNYVGLGLGGLPRDDFDRGAGDCFGHFVVAFI